MDNSGHAIIEKNVGLLAVLIAVAWWLFPPGNQFSPLVMQGN